MIIFDEHYMEESIQKLFRAIAHSRMGRAVRHVANGMRRILLGLWWVVGRVDSFFIVSGFFVCTGMVQLFLVLSNAPISAFDMITQNEITQMWLAAGFVLLGWLTGYSKSMVLITVAALVMIGYGVAVLYGVGVGDIDSRGLTVFVNQIFLSLAVLRSSWAEYQKARLREGLASMRAANNG